MADLGLADAVDAPEALLDAVRVPGQVVVDHQVGALQVDALPRGVGGHQHEGVLVLREVLLRLAALLAADAAVDGDHGLRPAEHDADLVDQVVERVAVLGEDDELAAVAVHVEHLAVVLQQARELLPLLVAAGDAHLVGELLQAGQRDDLVLQLLDGLRRRGLVDDLLLELLELLVGQVVELVEVLDVELGGDGTDGEQRLSLFGLHLRAAAQQLLLFELGLEALAAPLERLVDGLGRGGQAALQGGEREAHGDAAAPLALLVGQAVGAVHLLAHVGGDLGVEVGLLAWRART